MKNPHRRTSEHRYFWFFSTEIICFFFSSKIVVTIDFSEFYKINILFYASIYKKPDNFSIEYRNPEKKVSFCSICFHRFNQTGSRARLVYIYITICMCDKLLIFFPLFQRGELARVCVYIYIHVVTNDLSFTFLFYKTI